MKPLENITLMDIKEHWQVCSISYFDKKTESRLGVNEQTWVKSLKYEKCKTILNDFTEIVNVRPKIGNREKH